MQARGGWVGECGPCTTPERRPRGVTRALSIRGGSLRASTPLDSIYITPTLVRNSLVTDSRPGGSSLGMERRRLELRRRSRDLSLKFWINREAQSSQPLPARGLLIVVRSPFWILLRGRRIFTRQFRPIPGNLGPRITDCEEKVVRVVVSCDVRSRSESGGEYERIELDVPSLDLFRLVFLWGSEGHGLG